LAVERNGRCYDSIHENHHLAGSCPIIARNFSELFERLLDNQGDYWYWLRDTFPGCGDVYD
jgi:hypothetical protein